ncbi:hypothetical protein [Paenibacillus spongiae]|uniref:DNA-binding protein n=1 Tax=Paenibacillus spongiae TaxID=2909671 RepID=A0ABY5S3W4_9BACL|nr:hypothetical protein [Paenibacillus spongiae]UVI28597.1 hypothetical protein L1F29_24565 [Paenibacillus spongiae]
MNLSLKEYTTLAEELGGDVGIRILELVHKVEELHQELAGKKLPELSGSAKVAELLGIDVRNMHHKQKTKFFPEPALYVGSRPLWLERDIVEYKAKIDEWRREKE